METNNIEYEFVDVKKKPIEKTQLKKIANKIGMDTIFNMKGPTFRKMKLDYSALNASKKLDLLFENQNMIKRPLIENGDNYIAGFDQDIILDFVKK